MIGLRLTILYWITTQVWYNTENTPGTHTSYSVQPATWTTTTNLTLHFSPNSALYVTNVEVVPEPSTYAMMALGLCALSLMVWRRRRQRGNA